MFILAGNEGKNNLETVQHCNPKAEKLKERTSKWFKRDGPQNCKREDTKEMLLTWSQRDEIWCDIYENHGKSENQGNSTEKEEEKLSHWGWDPGEHANASVQQNSSFRDKPYIFFIPLSFLNALGKCG